MKFRITLEIEAEVGLDRAMERYGTTEPYAIVEAMQREFRAGFSEAPEGMRFLGMSAVPVHG